MNLGHDLIKLNTRILVGSMQRNQAYLQIEGAQLLSDKTMRNMMDQCHCSSNDPVFVIIHDNLIAHPEAHEDMLSRVSRFFREHDEIYLVISKDTERLFTHEPTCLPMFHELVEQAFKYQITDLLIMDFRRSLKEITWPSIRNGRPHDFSRNNKLTLNKQMPTRWCWVAHPKLASLALTQLLARWESKSTTLSCLLTFQPDNHSPVLPMLFKRFQGVTKTLIVCQEHPGHLNHRPQVQKLWAPSQLSAALLIRKLL